MPDDARIWKIRDRIEMLEALKDAIVAYWEAAPEPSEMWIGDAKEGYFRVVAAWQLLEGIRDGDARQVDAVAGMLEAARGSVRQSASELRAQSDDQAAKLHDRWTDAFEACAVEMDAVLEALRGPRADHPPAGRVVAVSGTCYFLLCTICGQPAVTFRVGEHGLDKSIVLRYEGIVFTYYLERSLAEQLFAWLQDEAIEKVHAHLIESGRVDEGVDGYCPPCDRVYCRKHYAASDEYDEGFYDCTYGTCPSGHRRMIAD